MAKWGNTHIAFGNKVLISESDFIAYYRFDNNVNSVVNGHNATSSLGISYVNGLNGGNKSVNLSSSNAYAIIPDADSFSFTDGINDLPFSVCLSINLNSLNVNKWVFSKRNSTETVIENDFFIGSDNKLRIILRDSSNNRIIAIASEVLVSGITYNYIVTYDGSKTAAGFDFYLDGVLDTNTTINTVGIYEGTFNSNAPLTLFNIVQNANISTDSKIDYLGFLNKEVNQEEVDFIQNKVSQGIELI